MLSLQELRSSNKKELSLELEKMRKELLKAHISVRTKHEKDTSKVKKIKCVVAQILTLLKEIENEPASKTSTVSVQKTVTVEAPVTKKTAKKKS